MRSTVVTSDDVSELAYGVVKGGKAGWAQRVNPGSEDQWGTEDCQVECVIIRGVIQNSQVQ